MRRTLKEPSNSILVVAAMWRPGLSFDGAKERVAAAFGETALCTPEFDFTQSSYYEPEMGPGLKKAFFSINAPQPRGSLPKWKHVAVALEESHLDAGGQRTFNVDPMLVSLENVVIATSKNFPHRVYLGQGVYGDLGLIRRRSGYEGFPWTYADYLEHLSFFEELHSKLRS